MVEALHETLIMYLFTEYELMRFLETARQIVVFAHRDIVRRLDLDQEQHPMRLCVSEIEKLIQGRQQAFLVAFRWRIQIVRGALVMFL